MPKSPIELDLASMPGFKRDVSPAARSRNEWGISPTGRYFALAYTIFEVSMMNDVGRTIWGRIDDGRGEVIGTPWVGACCWDTPWASWINDETFVFKAQYNDGVQTHLPLVAVRIDGTFAVIRNSNNIRSRPSHVVSCPRRFHILAEDRIRRSITASARGF